jgi:acetylornithine deacetylase/succinyl-diaminopimelate desuccinylase-like protein
MGVSAAEQAVLDRVDDTSLVSLTTALVRAAGQNPPGDEAATVNVLRAAAVELSLNVSETAVEPGRNNLRITLDGGAGPGLLMLGHTDVVPVGDGWTTDPFGGAVHNGRIYGRGASDMKGGLAASLAALAALRGVGLSGPFELAAGMAFHIILGMWMDDWGYELSEPIVVAPNGVERLTDLPHELTIWR